MLPQPFCQILEEEHSHLQMATAPTLCRRGMACQSPPGCDPAGSWWKCQGIWASPSAAPPKCTLPAPELRVSVQATHSRTVPACCCSVSCWQQCEAGPSSSTLSQNCTELMLSIFSHTPAQGRHFKGIQGREHPGLFISNAVARAGFSLFLPPRSCSPQAHMSTP
jgi:hypothetical protein